METDKKKGKTMNLPLTEFYRKKLRNHSNAAEAILWKSLKGKQVEGLKFRRQHGVGRFILDFYCPELKLAIELDGEVHSNEESLDYDEARTQYLLEQGITVMRFENRAVFTHQETIIEEIIEFKKKVKGM